MVFIYYSRSGSSITSVSSSVPSPRCATSRSTAMKGDVSHERQCSHCERQWLSHERQHQRHKSDPHSPGLHKSAVCERGQGGGGGMLLLMSLAARPGVFSNVCRAARVSLHLLLFSRGGGSTAAPRKGCPDRHAQHGQTDRRRSRSRQRRQGRTAAQAHWCITTHDAQTEQKHVHA